MSSKTDYSAGFHAACEDRRRRGYAWTKKHYRLMLEYGFGYSAAFIDGYGDGVEEF